MGSKRIKSARLARKVKPGTVEPSWFRKLGPGLITGAADDDPSGIATYSQAGTQFGLNMLWTVLFTYPLMVGIQIVSARIGRVTGKGLARNIRDNYPRWLVYCIVGLLLIANTINIAADVSAMGDALSLILGGPSRLYAAGFGMISLVLQVFIPYTRYVPILKWLTLALLTYVATAFVIDVPWGSVAKSVIFPRLEWNTQTVTMIVAVLGTTISPYLFFWQASQEVEEMQCDPAAKPLKQAPNQVRTSFKRINIDTIIGMGFSNLVAFFIILTTAITLNLHGVTNIQTSADAATALRPIAGEFAFLLFSLGIIGTGFLAVPVLAGASAYAVADAFNWKSGLEQKPAIAKAFYSVIAISTVIGSLLGFLPVDPIKALFWSAVINGCISVPIMAVMMLMASRGEVMGHLVISRRLTVLGWLGTLVMAVAVATMFATIAK
ncbi:MAG: divalent metal cation transporter [Pseudomonadota bacterium]